MKKNVLRSVASGAEPPHDAWGLDEGARISGLPALPDH